MDRKIKIAVLVSGGGTNLQALIDAQAKGEIIGGKSRLLFLQTLMHTLLREQKRTI